MDVRSAVGGDLPAVATVLDAAMLETGDLSARVDAGDVLVADEGGRVLGAVVVVPPERAPAWARRWGADAHVRAVAVRRRRRARGIGSALIAAALDRGRVTAAFRTDLRPFYESAGFTVEPGDDGRLRGFMDGRSRSG